MPQSIETMKRKGQRIDCLQSELHYERQCSEARCNASGLEMPAEGGGGEVRDAEEIHGAGEHDAGDAVEGAGDPGYLRAVDRQVRGDGAVAALGGEDGGSFGLGDGG